MLQITIDQMRADLLLRDRRLWSATGFRRLYDEGAVFADAHHAHAVTETVVGHATLATGSDPAVHGLVANAWFDRATGQVHHHVEDPRYESVGDTAAPSSATPPTAETTRAHPSAPASKTDGIPGVSPGAMLAPALADAIATAGDGKAQVWSLSLKERAAVPMGGHQGKAIWWSDASGEFVSSTFYFPDRRLPAWAESWNAKHEADHLDGHEWSLLLDRSAYVEGANDDMPWEQPPPGMGRTFPHRFDRAALGAQFYPAVEASPSGDDFLLELARALLATGDLGRDDVVDYLSVSFSASDLLGHRYGPSSLEVEDEVLRLDRDISDLLAAADAAAGPGHTLVVLSSDHGVGEAPAKLEAEHKVGGRLFLSSIAKSPAVEALAERDGGSIVLAATTPYLYVDEKSLRAHGVDPRKAARDLAAEVAKMPGVEAAFTKEQILSGRLPGSAAARAVKRNFEPSRSGDIHVVMKPGWQIAYDGADAQRFATTHGSPWDYDTHVPLVFAGPGVRHIVVRRRVETVDVAPTLAALAGVAKPSRANGHVLREALR